jgi:hypothetical protein
MHLTEDSVNDADAKLQGSEAAVGSYKITGSGQTQELNIWAKYDRLAAPNAVFSTDLTTKTSLCIAWPQNPRQIPIAFCRFLRFLFWCEPAPCESLTQDECIHILHLTLNKFINKLETVRIESRVWLARTDDPLKSRSVCDHFRYYSMHQPLWAEYEGKLAGSYGERNHDNLLIFGTILAHSLVQFYKPPYYSIHLVHDCD